MRVCNKTMRIMIAVLAFLTVFFGVNALINYIAGITQLYLFLQLSIYIITSAFLGLYTSLALGIYFRSKRKTIIMILISILSMGILLLPLYPTGWSKKGKLIIIATIILTMGFISSYWHYIFMEEECWERSLELD